MKLRRKLLSAGLALGATALTLTTSTFAWYTANTEVSASGVTGVSAANGSSLLLISSTGANGSYSNSVSLTVNVTTLQPVQYTVGTTAAPAPTFNSFANGAVSTAAAAATNYLTFDLYFRSPQALTVYLKTLTVTNTTTSMPTKDILTTAGTSLDDLSEKSSYKVDLLRALKMAYYTETHEGSATASATSVGAAFNFDSYGATYLASDDSNIMTNAHTYYNAVTGNHIATTGDDVKSVNTAITQWTTFGVTPAGTSANYDLCVHFYFFIDGWDLQCFDAVQGQTFTVSFDFTSDHTTN